MSGTRPQPPAIDDARIRLEGALEIVEQALAVRTEALRCFGSDWRARVAEHRDAFIALRDDDSAAAIAADKIDELSHREGWEASFGPRQTLDGFRRARVELSGAVASCLTPPQRLAPFSEQVETLLDESLPRDAGRALLRCPLAPRHGWLVLPGALLALATPWLTHAASLPGAGLAAMLGLAAASAFPWLLAHGQLELLPDRLRLRTWRGSKELALRPRLPRPAGSAPRTRLDVPGWGELDVLHPDTGINLLSEVAGQLRRPGFPDRDGPQAPLMVLPARSTHGPAPQQGALLLGEHGAWFLPDGQSTFEAAGGESTPWQGREARVLGTALGALSRSQQLALLERLMERGRARQVPARELRGATVSDGALNSKTLHATFPSGMGPQIDVWRALLTS